MKFLDGCEKCGKFAPFTVVVEEKGTGKQEEVKLCAYCKGEIQRGEVQSKSGRKLIYKGTR